VVEDKARDRVESGIRGGSATQVFGNKGRTQPGWTVSAGCKAEVSFASPRQIAAGARSLGGSS